MPDITPGSVGFCHSKGLVGRAIRLGERLRFRRGDFWNHVFIVSDEHDAQGRQLVIQAVGRGVTGDSPLITVAPGGKFEIATLPEEVDLDFILEFAKGEIGAEYSWLAILMNAVRCLLPTWVPLPRLRTVSSWICSALGAEALRFGGWLHRWPDIYDVNPAELWSALKGLPLARLSRSAPDPRKVSLMEDFTP